MSTDWKALAAELAAELERCRPLAEVPDCLARARAALAAEADGPAVQSREPASVVGEPSDEELLGIAAQAIEPYDKISLGEYEAENNCAIEVYTSELIAFARAVLARYGHQPAPPAEGEVGELVAELRMMASQAAEAFQFTDAESLSRAADLLEQRHPTPVSVDELLAAYRSGAADAAHPTPVPVSERLPGPGDCDEEGFCWWFSPADPSAGTFGVAACWVLRKHEPEDDFRTHWLPFNALPLPAGEVQP